MNVRNSYMVVGIALGMLFGMMLDNLAIGMMLGFVFGLALGQWQQHLHDRKSTLPK